MIDWVNKPEWGACMSRLEIVVTGKLSIISQRRKMSWPSVALSVLSSPWRSRWSVTMVSVPITSLFINDTKSSNVMTSPRARPNFSNTSSATLPAMRSCRPTRIKISSNSDWLYSGAAVAFRSIFESVMRLFLRISLSSSSTQFHALNRLSDSFSKSRCPRMEMRGVDEGKTLDWMFNRLIESVFEDDLFRYMYYMIFYDTRFFLLKNLHGPWKEYREWEDEKDGSFVNLNLKQMRINTIHSNIISYFSIYFKADSFGFNFRMRRIVPDHNYIHCLHRTTRPDFFPQPN